MSTIEHVVGREILDSRGNTTVEVEVPRTGAKRKNFELTDLGKRYLKRIEAELLV